MPFYDTDKFFYHNKKMKTSLYDTALANIFANLLYNLEILYTPLNCF